MSAPPPRPLSYASATTDAPPPPPWTPWRAPLAVAWLLLLLLGCFAAYSVLAADQEQWSNTGPNLFDPAYTGQARAALLFLAMGPALSAAAIGMAAAAALWHWPWRRLAFLALVPLLACLWKDGQNIANGSTAASVLLPPFFVAAFQGLLLFAGATVGRSFARFIATLLLPPNLAAELRSLWML